MMIWKILQVITILHLLNKNKNEIYLKSYIIIFIGNSKMNKT